MDRAQPLRDELQLADVILKLGGVIGSSSHFSSNSTVSELTHNFQVQLISVASRLPHADGEDGTCMPALRTMMDMVADIAKSLLQARVRFSTFPMLDLLRSCARGTPAASLERRMSNVNRQDDARRASGARRMVKAVPTQMAQRFGDAYCHADVLDHLLRAGQAMLSLAAQRQHFVVPSCHSLVQVNLALNAQAFPLLFDGMRLRAGMQMASTLMLSPSANTEFLVEHVLTSHDTQIDAARTRRAAAFFISAARAGGVAYEATVSKVDELHRAITEDLFECRYVSEQHSHVPPKTMRLILARVAGFAERMQFSMADESVAMRLALSVPCLTMSRDLRCGREMREAYDGGLLSIWDAVRLAAQARVHLQQPAIPLVLLLSMVLGSVVMSLMTPAECPFTVGPWMQKRVEKTESSWPTATTELPTEESERRKKRQKQAEMARAGRTERGKLISASASVCMVIKGESLKKARPRTEACEARYAASIGLMSTVFSFERELDRCAATADPRPTEGILALKRLYLCQLGVEPYIVAYLRDRPSMGSPLFEEDSTCVENTWRELVGGSILLFTMRKITEEAFRRTLREDWQKLEQVQKVLDMRAEDPNIRIHGEGVMTTTAAMKLLAGRAAESAEWIYDVNHVATTEEDFKAKRRVLSQQQALAKTAFRLACYSPLWECMITHLITTHNFGKAAKRKRT